MAESVGQIGLDLVVNQNQFKKQIAGITNLAKKAGTTLAAAFAVKKLVDFGKSCIDLGSDLAEVQNVVDVTFPSMSAQIDNFAKKAAASFGLSETMAKKFTGTFGAMTKAFGFTEKAAYDMGTTLTGLAGDVASFYNISQDEAYTKLKSVFTGETETLKDLGIVMTQSALDAYALANGYGKVIAKMSEVEKVALRYKFVQEQLTLASGDFVRTSDGWANQVRILKLQFDSLKATIGQGLINVLTPVLKVINILLGKLMTLANVFKSFTDMLSGNKNSAAANTAQSLADANTSAAGMAGAVADTAKSAKAINKSLAGFDKLNTISDTNGDITGGSSFSDIDFGTLPESKIDIPGDVKVNPKLQQAINDLKLALIPASESLDRFKKSLEPLKTFAAQGVTDFYNDFLKPVGTWGLGEGLPRLIDGLTNGLGKINFAKLTKSFSGLWKSLAPFATNIGKGLLNFYEHVLIPIGIWKFGEALPRFIDAISNDLGKINYEKIQEKLNSLWDAFTPFATNIGEGLLWCWENVLVPLGAWTANEVLPLFLEGLASGFSAINNILLALQPLGIWLWDNFLQPLAEWTGGVIVDVLGFLNEKLSAFSSWCAQNPDIIQGIAVAVSTFMLAFKGLNTVIDLWNKKSEIAAGATKILDLVIGGLKSPVTLIAAGIAALVAVVVLLVKNWDKVKEAAEKVWQKIQEIWGIVADWFYEHVIEPMGLFFDKLWSKIKEIFGSIGTWFKDKFTAAADGIKAAFSTIKDFFSDIWTGIKNTFGNVANWFKDKFSAAWQAVKNVFSKGGKIFDGIKDGILSGLKTVINGIISGINKVVALPFKGLNKALDTLRGLSILGVSPFGWLPSIDIPQIPKLAQGGYVKANTPQLAMIGDNRHQGEVVAPEDKLQELLDRAVSKSSANKEMFEIMALLRDILATLERIGNKELVARIRSSDVYRAWKAEDVAAKKRTGR